MTEFFNMGGYAVYVWSAYGLCFLVLGLNVFAARQRNLNVKKEIRKYISSISSKPT